MKGWIRSLSVLIRWIHSELSIKWLSPQVLKCCSYERWEVTAPNQEETVPWKTMELWGQKVKIGGLTFMFHKMGSYFCNWPQILQWLRVSQRDFTHIVIPFAPHTAALCGRLVKHYYQHRAKREKSERLSDLLEINNTESCSYLLRDARLLNIVKCSRSSLE